MLSARINKSLIYFSVLLLVSINTSWAASNLPYSVRVLDYSGWTAATQSDTNTTGMAGATVALPSSISSAQLNPAGFAMETGSLSAQINRVSFTDEEIQPDGQAIDSTQWGLGVSPPPWGFSISYYSPITESDVYYSPVTGQPLQTEVSVKEYRLTAARNFFDSRLAIGVAAELVKAVREIGTYSYDAYAPSFRIGALYRIRDHLIFGADYSPPLTIGPTGDPDQNALPGFNQAVLIPSDLDLGIGWVPNRFFKVGISLSYVGDTTGTALLSNQTVLTGLNPTWVPRAGASYILAQFKNFESELAVGSYYAPSRLLGNPNRLHATSGLEANPYFINLGVGFDLSTDYQNIMLGVGVDIIRTLRTFKIIPPDPTPPYNDYFPKPLPISADGLPDAMTYGEPKNTAPPSFGDVTQIVKEAPSNIVNKVKGLPTSVDKSETKKKKKRKSKTIPSPKPSVPATPRSVPSP